MRSVIIALLGITSAVYLLNPGFGIFELLPDHLPWVGNLDEASAAALLLACLRYFRMDPTKLFQRPGDGATSG